MYLNQKFETLKFTLPDPATWNRVNKCTGKYCICTYLNSEQFLKSNINLLCSGNGKACWKRKKNHRVNIGRYSDCVNGFFNRSNLANDSKTRFNGIHSLLLSIISPPWTPSNQVKYKLQLLKVHSQKKKKCHFSGLNVHFTFFTNSVQMC